MEEASSFSIAQTLPHQIRHIPAKRAFDIAFSILVLIIGLPIFLLIALAICCTSRGRIIYSHERMGRGGIPFRCYKFRTMYKDAESRLKVILAQCPEMRNEWEQTHKLKKDPRITKIGFFLRKTSLDELPQFWNVLKGDLSVVGPRPVVHAEMVKFYGVKAAKILSIRPGLTCYWQISGRNNTSYATRVFLDEKYANAHWSLSLDLKLIAKTIPAVLQSKGAY